MGRPYSPDLRGRLIAALDDGMSASAAGRQMRVAESTAIRWASIWRQEKRAEALPMGGDRRSEALEAHSATILSLVEERPDIFLHEAVAELASEGVSTSEDALSRLLARHGVTRKKRQLLPPNGSAQM